MQMPAEMNEHPFIWRSYTVHLLLFSVHPPGKNVAKPRFRGMEISALTS
jgi:hypothetical protein